MALFLRLETLGTELISKAKKASINCRPIRVGSAASITVPAGVGMFIAAELAHCVKPNTVPKINKIKPRGSSIEARDISRK